MWQSNWREELPQLQSSEWDIVIIGGGITGAGILLEAARRGLRALLVEQRDFAWGTSSRSSKLIHGGLRYLKEGKPGLTRDSVRERQHLLQQAPGLVEPQSFAFADYRGRKPGRWMFALGLAIYDRMAGQSARHYFARDEFLMLAPNVGQEELQGGLCYQDAKTDDARLVMRVLQEAVAAGGRAVNYMAASSLMRREQHVEGAVLTDATNQRQYEVKAKVVINATGAWADHLRKTQGAAAKLRPLRGSHLILPAWRLPLAQAVSFMHPDDGRPVFAFPWEGVTLVGTTDVDHQSDLQQEAVIDQKEVDYLMTALAYQFPQSALTVGDVISTYAGVRPVIDTGKSDPSKEGRDHAVWMEHGLLTVTGGKLTTFRLIALDALKHAAPYLPGWDAQLEARTIFTDSTALPYDVRIGTQQRIRLQGRYGALAIEVLHCAQENELESIDGTESIWAELRWTARNEAVVHLEDLMLRRTRLGLLLRGGGIEMLPRIRAICQSELRWDDARWEGEQAAYLALWQRCYAPPKQDQ
ncbi:MAG TPA: glycerol-3-phosphate dehydrogenase/oxidase [Burkholderiaceae bacterium]